MAKRCIKFTGYIYLPAENDMEKDVIYHTLNRAGRIEIFDEDNNRTGERMGAFTNLGQMNDLIEKAFKKRSRPIFKRIMERLFSDGN